MSETITLQRPADLPKTELRARAPVTLDEAGEWAEAQGAEVVYWNPITRMAFIPAPTAQVQTRDQYTEEWTVEGILRREG